MVNGHRGRQKHFFYSDSMQSLAISQICQKGSSVSPQESILGPIFQFYADHTQIYRPLRSSDPPQYTELSEWLPLQSVFHAFISSH